MIQAAAKALIPPVPHEDGPNVVVGVLPHLHRQCVNRMELAAAAVLTIQSKQPNRDSNRVLFPICGMKVVLQCRQVPRIDQLRQPLPPRRMEVVCNFGRTHLTLHEYRRTPTTISTFVAGKSPSLWRLPGTAMCAVRD